MSSNPDFDRWYAARHIKMVLAPSHGLETFDNTLVNYHLISELADHPNKIRVREGRLEAHKPLVMTPNKYAVEIEGFGIEAREFIDFLRSHDECMRILQYGYCLKRDNFSEQILTDTMENVTQKVKHEVLASHDRFAAVLQGEDDPWDVAIVELWRREVERSSMRNIKELSEKGELF